MLDSNVFRLVTFLQLFQSFLHVVVYHCLSLLSRWVIKLSDMASWVQVISIVEKVMSESFPQQCL